MLTFTSAACGGGGASNGAGVAGARGVIVVSAPQAGEVRRVLAREGLQVAAGDPLVEIAVGAEGQATPRATPQDPVARAGQVVRSSSAEVEAARAEVVRTEVEVQRLTPLVATGQATQGELDGARSLYERAQQRLRQAQAAEQNAQGGLVAARRGSQAGAGSSQAASAQPQEQLVVVRASSAATVAAVSARAGERVTQGQPLATLRTN